MNPGSTKKLTVLVAGAAATAAGPLETALVQAGFIVLASEPDETVLDRRVRELMPDAIVIHRDSPARDTLEHLAALHSRFPRPMLMLCFDADGAAARAAAQAGVSLYVVDAMSPALLRSLVDMTLLHFQDRRQLAGELEGARRALEERKCIDAAKCLLMEHERISEAEAYHRLRRLAMGRSQTIADVARALIHVAQRAGMAVA